MTYINSCMNLLNVNLLLLGVYLYLLLTIKKINTFSNELKLTYIQINNKVIEKIFEKFFLN